jgi:serine/threonine protein kinase
MTVRTTSEYLALLEKSQLLEATQWQQAESTAEKTAEVRQLAQRLVDLGLLTGWQSRFLLSGRHRLRIGQYRLLNQLPPDHAGDRFVAVHEPLNRKVEVLILPRSATQDRRRVRKFLREASRVAELDHDNLARLFDVDQQDGRYFLVFEHDAGSPPSSLPAGSLTAADIASIVAQTLDGIAYAHEQGVLHGSLDESRIRIDQRNRVTICNFGLAHVIDQLAIPGRNSGAFALPPDACNDVARAGQLGQRLFELHRAKAGIGSEKQLLDLLEQIARVTELGRGQTRRMSAALRDCSRQQVQPAAAPGAGTGNKETGKAKSTGKIPRTADGRRAASRRSRFSSDGRQTGRYTGWRLAAGCCCFLALAGGLWWASAGFRQVGGDNGDRASSSAKSETSTDLLTRNRPDQAPEFSGRESSASNSSTTAPTREKSGSAAPDDEAADPQSRQDVDAETETAVTAHPNTAPMPGAPASGNDPSAPDGASAATPAADTLPESVAGGLPLVPWSEAASYLDQVIVVYGTIVDVGSSRTGKTRYLNFRAGDYSAFKVVVRDRDLPVTEAALREQFLDQHVRVQGKVGTYRGNPQLLLRSLDQICVVDGLPASADEMANTSLNPGPDKPAATVFADLGAALAIPELTRDSPNPPRSRLGSLSSDSQPVGMFLKVPEEACRYPIGFDVQRASSGSRWEIRFTADKANVVGPGQLVAEIYLAEDALYFNWLEFSPFDARVNYLRNCLLEIRTPDESATFLLRKPAACRPVVLDDQRPIFRERIEIAYLPVPESVSIELLPLSEEEFPVQTWEPGSRLSTGQPEIDLYFEDDPRHRFFRLHCTATVTAHVELECRLELDAAGRPLVFNPRNLKKLEEQLLGLQTQLNATTAAAIQYQPVRGEKLRHKERLQELSDQLELVNAQVQAFRASRPLIESIPGQPLAYRICYTVGDTRFDLVK